MAVPSTNIELNGDINAEVASVNSGSLTTLSVNAIPAKTTPHGMQEFAGYTHTQNFPSHTYVRYYDSWLGNQSFTSSTNPYAANQSTISSSYNDITMYTQSASTDDYFAMARAGCDFRVRRNSSYLYLEVRFYGLGIVTPRYMYRENNQNQSVSSTDVGGGGSTGQGQTFIPIMRIQTGINPGGLQVAIIDGNSTHSSSGPGGATNTINRYGGDGNTGGNFSTYGQGTYHTLSTNNHSVGMRWFAQSTTQTVNNSFSNYEATEILNVWIRATGYYDQQIASIMPKGYVSVRNNYPSCQLCCIHDSMLVWTENDDKSIYDIEIGDEIVSHNFETGEDELVEVTDKILVERDVNYSVNSLILTKDHPVYLEGGRLASIDPDGTLDNYGLEVDELKIGDMMISHRSNSTAFQRVNEINRYEGTHMNYSLKTKHNNFYAGGVLVDSVINRGEG